MVLMLEEQFVKHFKSVLGTSSDTLPFDDPDCLYSKKLSTLVALYMVRDISDDEVKLQMFDIDGNKAPDGISSVFQRLLECGW